MPVGKGSIERATNAGNSKNPSAVKTVMKVSDILTNIAVSQIQPVPEVWRKGKCQSRYYKELARSIQAHGMIEPVILRRLNDSKFELLSGYQRLEAVKEIGMKFISSRVIEELSDEEAREIYKDLHVNSVKDSVNIHELKFEAVSAISSEIPVYLL